MKKRIVVLLMIVSLFSLMLISYKVSAEIQVFDLKDDFEDYINNRIYTEYDNYTVEEYFQDYISDQAHFTEDKEDFTIYSGATDNGISDSYFEIIALGDFDGYVTPLVNLTECFVLEFRMWVNVSTDHFYMSMRDYLDNSLGVSPHWSFTADTWKTITWIIPAESRDDIRKGRLGFSSSHSVYPVLVRLDYVKIWKGNYTDYFFQNGDSVDFGEGDYDNFIDGSYFYNKVITAEETFQWETRSGRSYGRQEMLNLDYDTSYYTDIKIRVKVNDTTDTPLIRFRKLNPTNEYASNMYISPVNTWVTLSLPHNWVNEEGTDFVMYCDSSAGTFTTNTTWELDYVLLYHDDLTDDHIQIKQDTSFYRASKGMRSFYKDLPLTFNYYEGYTANFNSSIKIDLHSVQFFPEKCYFNYYSNVPFNLSLFIDTTEYLLFENTNYLDEWFNIKENIERGDYLINSTTSSIFFELYTFKNTTEYVYIDELHIQYTDMEATFTSLFDSSVAGFSDAFYRSSSTNHLQTENSGEYPYCFSEDNGIGYYWKLFSTSLFSRRMQHDYTFRANSTEVRFTFYRDVFFSIDKEYKLRTHIAVFPECEATPNVWYVWIYNELFVDGVKEREYSVTMFEDYYFPSGNLDFKLTSSIKQEDYNSISCVLSYSNLVTYNQTTIPTIAFSINDGEGENKIKNSLNIVRTVEYFLIEPRCGIGGFQDSNTQTSIKIVRDIKHSKIGSVNPAGSVSSGAPDWDKSQPLKSIANILAYTIERIWDIAVQAFRSGSTIQDILGEIKTFGRSIIDSLSDIVSSSSGILANTGEGNNLLGNIFGGITNGFSNTLGKITDIFDLMDGSFMDFITDFFDNIITPFSESREEGEGVFGFLGNWGDISDTFQDDNWGGVSDAWSNFFPSMTGNLIENTSNFWGGFANNMFDIPLTDIFDTIVTFWGNFTAWLTLLIIIYLIWMAQMLVRGDWDRMRQEITTMVNIVNWVVSGVVRLIHWIFEVIWALLDVLIPFT